MGNLSRKTIFQKKVFHRWVELFGTELVILRKKNPNFPQEKLLDMIQRKIQNEIDTYRGVVDEWKKSNHIRDFLYDKALSEAGVHNGVECTRDAAASLLRQIGELEVLVEKGTAGIIPHIQHSAAKINASKKIDTDGARIKNE